MQIFAQLTDSMDSLVGDIATFGEDQISKPWSDFNYLLNGTIGEPSTAGKV
jgi:hypothetical protein